MFDVSIRLDNKPGEMARMGEALGAAGVSVEGGGGWVVDGKGYMHFYLKTVKPLGPRLKTWASKFWRFAKCLSRSYDRTSRANSV